MKKLVLALLLALAVQSVYAFGFFPRHRHNDFSGSPARQGGKADDVIPPIPEPETYLYMLVGIGVAAWIIRKKKK